MYISKTLREKCVSLKLYSRILRNMFEVRKSNYFDNRILYQTQTSEHTCIFLLQEICTQREDKKQTIRQSIREVNIYYKNAM